MATEPAKKAAPVKDAPAPTPADEKLEVAEVKDERDVSPRAPKPDTKGKRVRAMPAAGGTTVLVTAKNFADHGIKHGDVLWDFRKDNFTIPVGPKLSEEAADFLTLEYPMSFEYMDQR